MTYKEHLKKGRKIKMKKLKIILLIFISIFVFTGCSKQEVFTNANNEVKQITLEELQKETGKCFVIIGKEDDKYTNSLSRHLKDAVKIENEKIFLLYVTESQEEIHSLFSPNKVPTLYVVENNKILNSIEYYDDDDVAGMDSPKKVEYATSIREKITKFVEENKN